MLFHPGGQGKVQYRSIAPRSAGQPSSGQSLKNTTIYKQQKLTNYAIKKHDPYQSKINQLSTHYNRMLTSGGFR